MDKEKQVIEGKKQISRRGFLRLMVMVGTGLVAQACGQNTPAPENLTATMTPLPPTQPSPPTAAPASPTSGLTQGPSATGIATKTEGATATQVLQKATAKSTVVATMSSQQEAPVGTVELIDTNEIPAKILDLSQWKITIPVKVDHPDSKEKEKGKKTSEITQPYLANYQLPPWLRVVNYLDTKTGTQKKGVAFRAPVKGDPDAKTPNTDYLRSELRQMMEADNTKEISWNSSDPGERSMTIVQAVTALPKQKGEMVVGQIHGKFKDKNGKDKQDDVIVFRVERDKTGKIAVWVNVDGSNKYKLDDNYELGKIFKVKFSVKDGKTYVYYNDGSNPFGPPLETSYSEAFFKAGAYTQSSCGTEGDPQLCSNDNYGEVVIFDLKLEHKAA